MQAPTALRSVPPRPTTLPTLRGQRLAGYFETQRACGQGLSDFLGLTIEIEVTPDQSSNSRIPKQSSAFETDEFFNQSLPVLSDLGRTWGFAALFSWSTAYVLRYRCLITTVEAE